MLLESGTSYCLSFQNRHQIIYWLPLKDASFSQVQRLPVSHFHFTPKEREAKSLSKQILPGIYISATVSPQLGFLI